MNYGEKGKILKEAVMLIIKPLKVDKIKNIADQFIDWKPGLLRLAMKRHQVIFYTNVIKR